jgi:hypothetical protein
VKIVITDDVVATVMLQHGLYDWVIKIRSRTQRCGARLFVFIQGNNRGILFVVPIIRS